MTVHAKMETVDLTFQGLAYPGQTFGRDDSGRMIFAPFGLPGEKARVEIVDSHKRWAQARIIEILDPSPDRIIPRCQHFTDCGGCHYQHMPYELQLSAKADILRSQLERLGGIFDPPVRETIASDPHWNTRNHVQFSLDENGCVGFKRAASDNIIPIKECYLPDPDLSDLWPRLDLTAIPGLDRVALRSDSRGDSMVILHSDAEPEVEMKLDLPTSVIWLSERGLTVLAGEDHLLMEILEHPFRVSAGSFFQVHTSMATNLVQHALESMGIQEGETIFDLYAGVGLFSAFIAGAGGRLIAVEQSPWAASDFEVNLDEFKNVELYEASVEIALPAIQEQPDGILVDPPRAGLGRDVLKRITEIRPLRLVYVSCDPATLARDARHLSEAGYNLEDITPFDLFPQTYHIESISLWREL
ncbi:MAG: TRAM domain-containing protein [Anaerolineales bacterium]|nr:TRAM domain-containing protein [Anaerolineales bacterium]